MGEHRCEGNFNIKIREMCQGGLASLGRASSGGSFNINTREMCQGGLASMGEHPWGVDVIRSGSSLFSCTVGIDGNLGESRACLSLSFLSWD